MRFKKIVRQELYLSWPVILAALKVMMRGEIVEGDKVKEFEERFAHYLGVKYALSLPSGRMALYVSLKVLKLNQGSEIIIPSFNVPEVVSAIIWAGMYPKFVDINPETYNISPELIEEKISEKTGAILLTHLYGQPAQIDKILRIAKRYGVRIIEDAAQALGATYQGKKVGTFGEIAYFSFGLVKNLNCLGGGMLVTNHRSLYEEMKSIIQHYRPPSPLKVVRDLLSAIVIRISTSPFIFSIMVYPALAIANKIKRGIVDEVFNEDLSELTLKEPPAHYQVRFTNLQAAMGIEQLKILDLNNAKRRKNGELLSNLLKDHKDIAIPSVIPDVESTYLNYVITLKDRERVMDRLFKNGIDVTKGFLIDCSAHQLFKNYQTDSPHAQLVSQQGFYLPVYPSLEDEDILYIARTLKEVI